MAYGGLQEVRNFGSLCFEALHSQIFYRIMMLRFLQFIQEQNPEYVASLVRTRVLPIYSTSDCSPYLVASANWVLGELASCLPEVLILFFLYISLGKIICWNLIFFVCTF